MKTVKYYTITEVIEPTELNPYGRRYIATVPIMEQAVEGAKRCAARRNNPIEVTQCCMESSQNRTVRYNPDGTIEQLWKLEI